MAMEIRFTSVNGDFSFISNHPELYDVGRVIYYEGECYIITSSVIEITSSYQRIICDMDISNHQNPGQ